MVTKYHCYDGNIWMIQNLPITRLPAKYYDPVTQHPYANLQAFRILRETYYNQLEQKGDKSDPEVCKTYLQYLILNWL